MSESLRGKAVIVTGGATGIGAAVSRRFAKLGASVLIQGHPGDPVPELVEEIVGFNGRAEEYIGDISVEAQAEECVNVAVEAFGRLDVLINSFATPMAAAATDHFRVSEFDHIIYANLRSVFLMTRFALPQLRKTKGVVISSSTEDSAIGLALNPSHGASGAWIHAFMRGVALEAAQDGVRANSVCSGFIEHSRRHFTEDLDPDLAERLIGMTPLRRRGTPDEVSAVYAFLASAEASFVTGAQYTVDGGLSISDVGLGAADTARGLDTSLRTDPVPSHRSEERDLSL